MVKFKDTGILDLTSLMFESAADPSGAGWVDVYRRLSEITSSGPGSLNVLNKREERYTALADTNEPGFFEDFNREYFGQLPFKQELSTLHAGEAFHRRRSISDRRFTDTSIYQEHFRHFGIFHILHYCVLEDESAAAGITFTRPETMKDFEPATRSLMAKIIPTLQRAMRLHFRVVAATHRDKLVAESWDQIPQGVILVSEKGRIAYMNASAERTLRSNYGLSITRGGALTCSKTSETSSLKCAIQNILQPHDRSEPVSGGAMRVQRSDGKYSLSLLVVPFRNAGMSLFGSEKYAAVFISDLNSSFPSIGDSLVQAYDLTAAESNVAQLLAEGHSLRDIGDSLSITQNTVKTHLKHIFAKTDTQRQSSLMKILLHMPRTIDRSVPSSRT